MRVGAHRLDHHLHQLLDMAAIVDRHAGLAGQSGICLAIIGLYQLFLRLDISAVKRESEFVIVAFTHPPDCNPELFPQAEIGLGLGIQRVIKQLVVAVFIGGDAACDLLQYRFLRRVADGAVIGRGGKTL